MTKLGKMILLGALGVTCSLASPQKGIAAGSVGDFKVPDGVVELYGQSVNPSEVKAVGGVYPWAKAKSLIPELLPDAKTLSMAPDKFCDHIVLLEQLYAIEADKSEDFLVTKLADVYPDEPPFKGEPLAFAVSDRLASASPKKINELMTLMPGYEERIFVVQDIVRKHIAMTYVHDAALKVCTDHAKTKGYASIHSYDGPDKDYDPENDPGWDEFEETNK